MNCLRICLVRIALPLASLFAFAAASGLGVQPSSGAAVAPQSPAAASATSTTAASPAPSTTTLSLVSQGNPVTSIAPGTPVTLTAQVTATTHAAISPGQVKFCNATAAHCEDSAIMGTAQLTSTGRATYTFVPRRGPQSYQAFFLGTHAFAPSSSGPVTLSVGKQVSTTTVTASGPLGDATLTAAVTGFDLPALTGEVVFADITNAMQLGTASLGAATSSQSFSYSTFNEAGEGGGYYPSSLLLVDVNGDGIEDLVTARQPQTGEGTVVVQPGNGDGSFGPGVIVYAGSSLSVAAGDFNSDGITDLAVGTGILNPTVEDSLGITVLLGRGDGTFTAEKPIALDPFSYGSLAMVAADVNGDGVADLIAADGYTLYVLFGKGAGKFSSAVKTVLPFGFDSFYAQDLNGDGVPDIVGMDDGGQAFVCLGNADGTFTFSGRPGSAFSAAVADFNGDGIPDLVLVDPSTDGDLTVLLGNGDGTFTFKSTPIAAPNPFSAVAADFDGDGIEDLVVSSSSGTVLLLGIGDGTFKAAPLSLVPSNTFLSIGLTASDLNADGLTDVVGYNGIGVLVALNGITATAQATLGGVSVPRSPTQYVTAAYSGDTETAPSTSASLALAPTAAATTLQLGATPAASTYGTLVNLTATLNPYSLPGVTSNGDQVTFYSGESMIGEATLSSGVATFKTTYLPVGTDELTAVFAGDTNFATSTSSIVTETVTAGSGPTSGFVVSVNTDDAVGLADNCAGPTSSNCSLRDALAAALVATGGNITFSPTVFAASQPASARTISLDAVLILPSNTTITGPTTSNGTTLTQLVTLTPLEDAAFEIDKGTAHAAISGLAISGGYFPEGGGGAVRTDGELTLSDTAITGNVSGGDYAGSPAVFNDADGTLTLTNCDISGNSDFADPNGGGPGGGILNYGTLVVTNSTISDNSSEDAPGGGLLNGGTATLTNTTVSGNEIFFYNNGGYGGGIYNYGTLNLVDSSVTGNSASNPGQGSGIYNTGTLHITESSITGNFTNYNETYDYQKYSPVEDDCDGPGCPVEKLPAAPLFSPPSGTYSDVGYAGVYVNITDTTPGTVIFDTTDGSTPTASSDVWFGGQPIDASTIFKASAYSNGFSPVSTATYTIAHGECTIIDYSKGFTPTALTLNGGATVEGGLLQLTDGGSNEARSAFYSTLVPTTEFTTDFQFQLVHPLADGITFTIQSASPDAVGASGGGLGYAGIPKSVALKFDLFNNSGEGFDSSGYYFDGAYPSTPAVNLSPYGIHLHSGHTFAVHITYIGGVTTATITDLASYQSASATIPGDLSKVVGDKAYVGFTGGTGLLSATQNILTWTYGGGAGCGTLSTPQTLITRQ